MINLIKKENINLGILETDFDIFSDIANTFSSEVLKKDCLIDLDDYIMPDYFKNKITIVLQTNEMLIGYVMFEFENDNKTYQSRISKLYVQDEFKNKGMETLLVESVLYMTGEVGGVNTFVTIDEHDNESLKLYNDIGFREVGMDEEGTLLSANVQRVVNFRKLNDKFRDIEEDAINYKNLKLVKKIASGRDGNIYLTSDNKILKMFKSNSFTFIKDREETLRKLKKLPYDEIVKPKNLVYYDGVFVGYIMEYLPDGEALSTLSSKLSFEDKIDKIKKIEEVMKMLHKDNIYIGDLNPENIFFDDRGNIRFIDCDAFVIKSNVMNNKVDIKYQDPYNKIVSKNTDVYSFAISVLEILTDIKIDKEASKEEIVKIYNKNKNKLPVSFKNYFDGIFNFQERKYLTDSYQEYMNKIYDDSTDLLVAQTSGRVSIIILSLIFVLLAVVIFLLIKKNS